MLGYQLDNYAAAHCGQANQAHSRAKREVGQKVETDSSLVGHLGRQDKVQLLDRVDLVVVASVGLMWKRGLSCVMLQVVGQMLMRLDRAENSYQRFCFLAVRRRL